MKNIRSSFVSTKKEKSQWVAIASIVGQRYVLEKTTQNGTSFCNNETAIVEQFIEDYNNMNRESKTATINDYKGVKTTQKKCQFFSPYLLASHFNCPHKNWEPNAIGMIVHGTESKTLQKNGKKI